MLQRRSFLPAIAIATTLLSTSALAQDATIYYETPTIRSGQPVENAVPVMQPVPVATPRPNSQPVLVDTPEGSSYIPAPATPATAADSAYLGTPQVETSATDSSVTYVSGGIGQYEKQWFDSQKTGYNLKVSYNDTTGHNLAGVNVTLTDKEGNAVVNTTTDGPFLLVNAKPGTYTLTSEYQGTSQTRKVTLGKGLGRVGVTFKDIE